MGDVEVFSDHGPLRSWWHVVHYQYGQRVLPRQAYWWTNAKRRPADLVVLQYSVRGRILYRDPHGEVVAGPGSALLFAYDEPSTYGRPPGEPLWAEGTYECDHVALTGAGLREHWAELRQRYGSVVSVGSEMPLRPALRRLVKNIRARKKDPIAEASAVHSFVMELATHLGAQVVAEQSPVERALDEMTGNPLQPWSIKTLALRHGCSREHLERMFRTRFGESPAEYLRRIKFQHAQDLLRETDLPLSTIAVQSGIASLDTLKRWLRAQREASS